MEQYLNQARRILSDPSTGYKPNRTGVDTISLFGHQERCDLREGFPLLTTKKMQYAAIIHELLWFMRGETNIKYLIDNNVHIWDEWGFERYLKVTGRPLKMYSPEWRQGLKEYAARIKEDAEFARQHGELGPVYGKQWRKWEVDGRTLDQFGDLLANIKRSPASRRLIVSAWNPAEVPSMALPPCHTLWHVNVQDDFVDLQLYQRSADTFIGVPFNIASYAALTQIIAEHAGRIPRNFVHTFGDTHFYCGVGDRGRFYGENLETLKNLVRSAVDPQDYLEIKSWIENNAPPETEEHRLKDHVPLILEQLSRAPRKAPLLSIKQKSIDELVFEDFTLEGYDPHPAIKASIAV